MLVHRGVAAALIVLLFYIRALSLGQPVAAPLAHLHTLPKPSGQLRIHLSGGETRNQQPVDERVLPACNSASFIIHRSSSIPSLNRLHLAAVSCCSAGRSAARYLTLSCGSPIGCITGAFRPATNRRPSIRAATHIWLHPLHQPSIIISLPSRARLSSLVFLATS